MPWDTNFGWNPFTDITSLTHDVQQVASDTVGKIPGFNRTMSFLNAPYTALISRPLSTIVGFVDEEDYKQQTGQSAPWTDLFSGSNWKQAWDNSATMSPGQGVVIGLNSIIEGSGNSMNQLATQTPAQDLAVAKSHLIDPYNQQQREQFFGNNSFANVASGGIDMLFRTLDPVAALQKIGTAKILNTLRQPIRGDITPQAILARPSTQEFLDSIPGKSFTQLSQDPRFRSSPTGYKAAALLTSAKDAASIRNIYSIALGDTGALASLIRDRDTIAQKVDQLDQMNPYGPLLPQALALSRASAILAPLDTDLKSALADLDPADLVNAQAKDAIQVAQHARQLLMSKLNELNNAKEVAGQMTQRTRVGRVAQTAGAIRAQLSIANGRAGNPFNRSVFAPKTMMTSIQDHVADPIVRIYQSLSDQSPTKAVDFSRDDSVVTVRSMLNTFSALDPDIKDSMLARYARADRGARQLAFFNIERQALRATAEKWGLSPAQAEAIYKEYVNRRGVGLQAVQNHAYGTLDSQALGSALGAVAPFDNASQVVVEPRLLGQLSRGAVPAFDGRDLDLALQRASETGLIAAAHSLGHSGASFLVENLDKVYDLWKGLTLITGHRAYNHVGDDALRSMVKLGALSTVENIRGGAANFLRNRFAQYTKAMQVRNVQAKFDVQVNQLQSTLESLIARRGAQQDLVKRGVTIAPENLVSMDDISKAKKALGDLKRQGPQFIQVKHRLGQGTFRVPGTQMTLPDLFGGPDADYMRQLFGGDHTFQELFQTEAEGHYNSLNVLADHDNIGPMDSNGIPQPKVHANAILRYVKNQLAPDPAANRMLAGMSEDEVRQWMLNTADGRTLMKQLHIGNPADHLEFIADQIGRYLPSDESKAAALAGKYSMKNLEQDFPAPSTRPAVSGNMALYNHLGSPSKGYIRSITNKLIRLTGSLPDDILVRHPLATRLYKANMTDAVHRIIAQEGKDHLLTSDELNTVRRASIDQTRKTMQDLLYDSSRFTSAGKTLRFVIPFFNAWHNALSSWSHLIAQNPQLILRGWQAKQALWGSPAAVDINTGKPPTSATGLDDLALVMHLPGAVAKMLGMSDDNYIPIAASTLISPTYTDSIGNPGFGPLVTVPVNHMVKEDPGLLSNPFVTSILGGRITSNDLASMIPSSVTQVADIGGLAGITGSPDNVASRSSLMWTIYQEQYYDYLNGKRSTPPNWNDIGSQASWLAAFDGIVNRILPLGFKPEGNHQYLIDEYHQMESVDPQNAQQDFYDKYGNAGFVFTQSLSSDPSGISSTVGSAQAYKRYLPMIQQFPELASVIIGPDGNGSYNDLAYQWEVANGLRTYLTPQEAATKEQVNLGWQKYDQIASVINSQLAERGLVSVNQSGASDLKTLKTAFVNATSDPSSSFYNPDWYSAYGGFNQNSYDERISDLEQIAQDPTLLANPARSDIQSLNAYFQLRDIARAWLQARPSQDLKAVANEDIANWLDYYVGVLQQSDTKFATIYETYLKNDDLKLA